MQRSFLPAAALTGALVLTCANQPAPSELADAFPPSLRTERNPEGPGALVIRSAFGSWLTSDPDPAPGLTALVGWTFAELAQVCVGGEQPPRIEDLTVVRPHGTAELPDLHQVLRSGQVPLLVWQATIPFINPGAEVCGTLLGLPHLTGTGHFIRTDNDLVTTGTRANAAHEGIAGTVTSETGERFRFSGKFHILIHPSGDERVSFDLGLKPIGG